MYVLGVRAFGGVPLKRLILVEKVCGSVRVYGGSLRGRSRELRGQPASFAGTFTLVR